MPLGRLRGRQARLRSQRTHKNATGPALLGRVSDALGAAVDGLGPIRATGHWPLSGRPLPPLLFWDVLHPTAPVHALIGATMYTKLALSQLF